MRQKKNPIEQPARKLVAISSNIGKIRGIVQWPLLIISPSAQKQQQSITAPSVIAFGNCNASPTASTKLHWSVDGKCGLHRHHSETASTIETQAKPLRLPSRAKVATPMNIFAAAVPVFCGGSAPPCRHTLRRENFEQSPPISARK